MTNIFTDLQEAIAVRLDGDSWISADPAIRVITEARGDLENEINRRIGACGLCVVVTTPKFTRGNEAVRGELEVTVLVGIAEMVRTNRGPTGTHKTAGDVAVSVTALLLDWNPGDPWTRLDFDEATLVDGPKNLVTWQVGFTTRIRVTPVDETLGNSATEAL